MPRKAAHKRWTRKKKSPRQLSHKKRKQTSKKDKLQKSHCPRLRLRFLPKVLPKQVPKQVPKEWVCRDHPEPKYQVCVKTVTRNNNDKVRRPKKKVVCRLCTEYSPGSMVLWAKLGGLPWWPAMVDDDVDIKQFYWSDGVSIRPLILRLDLKLEIELKDSF